MDNPEMNKEELLRILHEVVCDFRDGIKILADPGTPKEEKFLKWLEMDQILFWGEKGFIEALTRES